MYDCYAQICTAVAVTARILNTRFIRSSQQAIAAAIAAIVPCIQRDTCEAVSKLYSRLPDIQLEYEISRRTIGGCLSGVP